MSAHSHNDDLHEMREKIPITNFNTGFNTEILMILTTMPIYFATCHNVGVKKSLSLQLVIIVG